MVFTGEQDLPEPLLHTLMAGVPQLAAVLGSEEEANRALVNTAVAIQRNPALMKADPQSLFLAVVQVAQWGLDVGTTAHLVPFFSTKQRKTLVTPMKNYKGVVSLVIQAKAARSIEVHAVYAGETFEVAYGTDASVKHVPDFEKRRNSANLTHVYAVAHIGLNVPPKFIVLSRHDVERYRAMSKFADSSFWRDHYEAMAKKTAVHRLGDTLPQSARLRHIFANEEPDETPERTALESPRPGPTVAREAPTEPEGPLVAPPAPPTADGHPTLPFGKSKGVPLGRMTTEALEGALAWAVGANRYKDFQMAARAELDLRAKPVEKEADWPDQPDEDDGEPFPS